MKYYFLIFITTFCYQFTFAQSGSDFLKTKSGLLYKIYKGEIKIPTSEGDVLKMNVIQKVSGSIDTVLTDTHGKMPVYVKIEKPKPETPAYGPDEIFNQLRKGDSLVSIIFVDSLLQKGIVQESQLPPFLQKGDKIAFNFNVIEVFKTDSLAQFDYEKEMEMDSPRKEREQREMMEITNAKRSAMIKAEDEELRKSGEMAKQIAHVENYLKNKGINYEKTPLGTFVKIDNPGNGDKITDGKFVRTKYTLRILDNDSTIEKNSFTMKTGENETIRGFDDGLKSFREGGKGTIYIPGYLAYGKNPPSILKPYEHLIFDVEILNVSDENPFRDEEVLEPPQPVEDSKMKQ